MLQGLCRLPTPSDVLASRLCFHRTCRQHTYYDDANVLIYLRHRLLVRTAEVERRRKGTEGQEGQHGDGLQQERRAPAEGASYQAPEDVPQRVPHRDAQVKCGQPPRLGPSRRIIVWRPAADMQCRTYVTPGNMRRAACSQPSSPCKRSHIGVYVPV